MVDGIRAALSSLRMDPLPIHMYDITPHHYNAKHCKDCLDRFLNTKNVFPGYCTIDRTLPDWEMCNLCNSRYENPVLRLTKLVRILSASLSSVMWVCLYNYMFMWPILYMCQKAFAWLWGGLQEGLCCQKQSIWRVSDLCGDLVLDQQSTLERWKVQFEKV